MPGSSSISSSLTWKFFERFSVQIVQFIVSIVIARILLPEQYGVMAILNIFIIISSSIVQSGLGQYLIQKESIGDKDYSVVLFCSLMLAIILYVLLFVTAPLISLFFKMPELTGMLRILSLVLFITAFSSVQMAYIRRNMLFRNLTSASLISAICSGLAGVFCALKGAGTWSLIVQQLVYHLITPAILLFTVNWKPSLSWDKAIAEHSFSFGIKLLVADLVDRLYHSLENVIVGRVYSKDTLAFFDRGKQFPLILIDNVDGSVQSVIYPAYSRLQNDQAAMKGLLGRSIRMSTFLSFLSMATLLVVASPLIHVLLGDKWMPAVPFLQAYCIITMLFPFQTALLQAFIAKGEGKVYFYLTLIKRVIGAILLISVVFLFDSVFAIVWTCLVIEPVGVAINLIPALKHLGYGVKDMIRDVIPNLLIAVVVVAAGLWFEKLFSNPLISLSLTGILSLVIIVVMSFAMNNESYNTICEKLHLEKYLCRRSR